MINRRIAIVGAGLTGAVLAERLAQFDDQYEIDIYEKRDHIGGNCYDYIDENGILVSKYGPHFFHTNNEEVWHYLQRFAEWVPYEHKTQARVLTKDGKTHFVPVPVNIDTVNGLFGENIQTSEEMDTWLSKHQIPCDNPQTSEDVALSRVGRELFDLIFKEYTIKQWEKEPKELNPSVLARIPVRNNFDGRYFADKYQALPKGGYTKMIENMISYGNIKVLLNVDYLALPEDLKRQYDRVYFTGPIDQYFKDAGLENLEYRSLIFQHESIPSQFYQPVCVVNEPSLTVPYTRTTEYKHLPNFDHRDTPSTTIVREYSTSKGDPYYPVPNKRNLDLYAEYQKLAAAETLIKNVHFVGRLASYKYFNMDEAIAVALQMFKDTELNTR